MSNYNLPKTLVVLFFTTFTICASAHAEGGSSQSSGGAHPSKKLFDAKCASCHGKDLKGNKTMAKAFKVEQSVLDLTDETTAKKTDEELIGLTSKGVGKMPAYEKSLKPSEISGLVQHLRSVVPQEK